MTTYVFSIRTLTNLHAGSGDSGGTGVVDKLVQRDPITKLPIIHASGIKGALREHFEGGSQIANLEAEQIFGSTPKNRDADKVKQGNHRFFSADLLALPIPVDHAPYFQVIGSQTTASKIQERYKLLQATIDLNLLGLKIVNDETAFSDAAEDLPVIARNFLDNGISKNLWYEEVVPRESTFITCIQATNDVLVSKLDGAVVQLGGNATVGYGFCLFTQLHPQIVKK